MTAPEGYNVNEEDDVHSCSDSHPSVSSVSYSRHANSNTYRININITKGNFDITSVVVKVDGVTISTALPAGNTLLTDYTFNKAGQNITVEVADSGGYKVSKSYTGPSSVTPESSASPSI